MTETQQESSTKLYCNVIAQENGIQPAGYAQHLQTYVLLETPLPWQRNPLSLEPEESQLPSQIADLARLAQEQYKKTGMLTRRSLYIAPDEVYSKDGFRRVMIYQLEGDMASSYKKVEYWVPTEQMGALVWAYFEDQAKLPNYEPYRVPEADTFRDVLVCTHGSRDVACAKFGYPIYKHLRENHADDTQRIWRVTHFGGHLFAPTLVDLPRGDYWAYVDEDVASQIMRRDGDITTLRGHYRGWAGMPPGFSQVLDYTLLMREGWQWQQYMKKATILAQDDDDENPQWADVRIDYRSPDGNVAGTYLARVIVENTVQTIGNSNHDKTHLKAQYAIDGTIESV
ncbi:MAG: sucrase ferredoxin [Chloroflexota bacterium]